MDLNWYYIPGILVVSFLISLFAYPSYIKLLEKKKLLDVPDHRKIHKRSVPSMGGVVMILGMLITIIFFFPIEQLLEFRFFIGGLMIMFIVGLRDDLVPFRPALKLISQLVPIMIVIFFFDIKLESFYSLSEIVLPLWIQVSLTAFTMVIIINSFNLIDGVDGLAGSLSLTSLTAFATLFFLQGNTFFALLLLAMGGSILGFLAFNWAPAKIFMGDNGALFIGFILACSSILFIREATVAGIFEGVIGTALALMAVPLYDMFRIIFLRIFLRKRLMKADRNHIHHKLLDLGFSHAQVTMTLFSVQAFIIFLTLMLNHWPDWAIFSLLAVILFGLNGILFLVSNIKTKTQKSGV